MRAQVERATPNFVPSRVSLTKGWRASLSPRRLFLEHPASIGETYFEHQRSAFFFGGTMLAAGIACLLHGLLPAVFQRTGSRAVSRLYDHMSTRLIRGQL